MSEWPSVECVKTALHEDSTMPGFNLKLGTFSFDLHFLQIGTSTRKHICWRSGHLKFVMMFARIHKLMRTILKKQHAVSVYAKSSRAEPKSMLRDH